MTNPPVHPIAVCAEEYLAAFGRTRGELTAYLGVNPSTVSRWWSGATPIPVDTILKIEEFVGLPRGRLLLDAGYVDVERNREFDKARRKR